MLGYRVYKDIGYALKICRYGLPGELWYKFYRTPDGLNPSSGFSSHIILEFDLLGLEPRVEELNRFEFEVLGPIEPGRVTIYEGLEE